MTTLRLVLLQRLHPAPQTRAVPLVLPHATNLLGARLDHGVVLHVRRRLLQLLAPRLRCPPLRGELSLVGLHVREGKPACRGESVSESARARA